MHITINTSGTRGDVQPHIALGKGLQQFGHTVQIVTHRIFGDFVRENDLDFSPINPDPREVVAARALSELGNNPIRINRWMKETITPVLREMFEATLTANRETDLMLISGLSFPAWHVAEKLDVPALAAYLWPVTPSRHFMGVNGKPPPRWMPLQGMFNYYTTKAFNQLFFNLMIPPVNECRADILNLKPVTRREYWGMDSPQSSTPFIYGYSPVIVPKPPDWSENQQISGYWFLNTAEGYTPQKELLEFIERGEPPVYIGFGSMVDHEREQVQQIIIDALSRNNQRGVLHSGWSGFGSEDLPDFVLPVGAVPHDWLFPRMAAVVHHGGAGTTAAGLHAGVPSVIVPSFGDQFFWGRKVQEREVGPTPVSRKKLTVDKLAEAIRRALTDNSIRENARQIGKKIRAENGVENAAGLIEGFMRDRHL